MRITDIVLALCFCLAANGFAQEVKSDDGNLQVTIDTRQPAPPVSKYVFGMFTEHIRNSLYRSVWAEMLDDRKFYFPIAAKEQPLAAGQGPGPASMALHKWRPVGPESAVTMDRHAPFVGDQSPRVELDGAGQHGISQSGLALVKGKRYTGRVVLRGTHGARVQVALVWGQGKEERQTLTLPALKETYQTLPIHFLAPADAANASFEITATGSGDFHVGAVSLMPADNEQGFRPEAIAALRQIDMGFWRYGGNYTSNLIWYHVVGDPDKRPPDFDYAWNAMQPNDLGLDEFMTLCRLLHVDAYISVNAGFGDSHSAAEEVEYMNGAPTTYMGAKRARNGHPEPYHVRFWNIGNEPWGSWQLGRTDTKYFMLKHNEFAKAMRAVDPNIVLIASGRMLQQDTLRGDLRTRYAGNIEPLFGSESDWTGSFLAQSWGNFDGIAEHWYAQPGRHFDIDLAKKLASDASNEEAYVKVDQTLQQYARYPADIVKLKAEEWQGYQTRFPAMAAKNIFLSIDEYAYFGGAPGRAATLKTDLAYAMILNEMMRHSSFLTMAAHTTGSSMMDVSPTGATLNALGVLFKLYSHQFAGAVPVALSGNSPQPAPRYPPGADQPQQTSGSPTYPLDMFAATSADGRVVTLAVVNATETEQGFHLDLAAGAGADEANSWQLTADTLEAANRVGQQPQVAIKEAKVSMRSSRLSVAPISITLYQWPLPRSAGGQ